MGKPRDTPPILLRLVCEDALHPVAVLQDPDSSIRNRDIYTPELRRLVACEPRAGRRASKQRHQPGLLVGGQPGPLPHPSRLTSTHGRTRAQFTGGRSLGYNRSGDPAGGN